MFKLNSREKRLFLFLIALIILFIAFFLQGKFIQQITNSRADLNNEIEKYELVKQQLAIINLEINQDLNQLSLDELIVNLNSSGFNASLDEDLILVKNIPVTKLQELIISLDSQKNILKNVRIEQSESIFLIEIAID
tara:strand:+ start:530 stop:940 length:411 start_codon:yes stop_codon:yes gene_type:complete